MSQGKHQGFSGSSLNFVVRSSAAHPPKPGVGYTCYAGGCGYQGLDSLVWRRHSRSLGGLGGLTGLKKLKRGTA